VRVKVVFIQPSYPPEQQEFTRGLAEVGAQVIGVGSGAESAQPAKTRRHLAAWLDAGNLLDERAAAQRIAAAVARLGVDRVESLWEPTVALAARVRALLGLPGMDVETARGFRDKQVMMERARAAGVRVPRSRRVRTGAEAWAAAEEIGFPLIFKPIAGAGSADTFRCDDADTFGRVLGQTRHVAEAVVAEFIEGEEFTCDAVVIDGEPVFESVSQYFPRPLVARSEQWISPAQVTFRDPYQPDLLPAIAMSRQVIRGLGLGTGFTHMEWYRTAQGEVVFGEIGARNGGGHLVDMMNWSNDIDVYREWARAVCWGTFEAAPARRYAVGMVFKRALGEGRIRARLGVEEVTARCGRWLVADQLLPVGAQRRDWRQTLVSDGFAAVRHPDERQVRTMMGWWINDVRMFAGR
jgi:biotin carboxylase